MSNDRGNAERQRKAWRQLGALLTARRAEIDPRYVNRRKFCAETGINYKVISDIEGARRTNFSPEMLSALEVAYELEPGAITFAAAGPVDSLRTRTRTRPLITGIATAHGMLLVPDVPPNMTEAEKAQVQLWASKMSWDLVRLREDSNTELPDQT